LIFIIPSFASASIDQSYSHEQAPMSAFDYVKRGTAYLNDGEYDKALADFDKAIRLDPKLHQAYEQRGNVYGEMKNWDLALADYEKAVALKPDCASVYSNRAAVLLIKKDYDKALIDINKALSIDPTLYNAYAVRGEIYLLQEKYDYALAEFTKGIILNPEDCCLYYHRAQTFSVMGNYQSAIEDCNSALQNRLSNKASVLQLRGVTHYRSGQFANAAEDFRENIKANPGYDYTYIWLLLASRRLDKEIYIKTLADFRNYVLQKRSETWQRFVSKYFLGLDGVTEQAMLSEAEKGKTQPEIRERLCEAYYYLAEDKLFQGQRKEAEDYFQKSIETEVKDFIEYANSKAMLKMMREGKI
jgi:tetratricopeptide (TPR) repeat protein